ncbi:MAG: hypothetical protein J0I43_03660 [Microbacterium sp.]|uniref:hypothetical protein n=1 Tax=Microbacterium sp. TaxID=51671 RepID=UPI001AC1B4BA|nr:hypothetical protein [Microbacterium sp.]MBN9176449.1 hypothetical protein [Microbacterium sp.]
MSNRRKPTARNRYRAEFLRSPAWFARRNRWFAKHERLGIPLVCAACDRPALRSQLELHHVDYAGVSVAGDGSWRAFEPHADLVPLHPYCHELVHRLIDRDVVLSRNRTRRAATEFALQRVRAKLTHQVAP